jgi:hypothetical protein
MNIFPHSWEICTWLWLSMVLHNFLNALKMTRKIPFEYYKKPENRFWYLEWIKGLSSNIVTFLLDCCTLRGVAHTSKFLKDSHVIPSDFQCKKKAFVRMILMIHKMIPFSMSHPSVRYIFLEKNFGNRSFWWISKIVKSCFSDNKYNWWWVGVNFYGFHSVSQY